MKRQQSGEDLMGEKLNEIVAPPTTGLWQQMQLLLDEKMPQQNGRVALQHCMANNPNKENIPDQTNPGSPQAENPLPIAGHLFN